MSCVHDSMSDRYVQKSLGHKVRGPRKRIHHEQTEQEVLCKPCSITACSSSLPLETVKLCIQLKKTNGHTRKFEGKVRGRHAPLNPYNAQRLQGRSRPAMGSEDFSHQVAAHQRRFQTPIACRELSPDRSRPAQLRAPRTELEFRSDTEQCQHTCREHVNLSATTQCRV